MALSCNAAGGSVLERDDHFIGPDEAKVLADQFVGHVGIGLVGIEQLRAGEGGAWWCRTCDFAACGRPEGRCPAQRTAAALRSE